jgi:hypothetical protein
MFNGKGLSVSFEKHDSLPKVLSYFVIWILVVVAQLFFVFAYLGWIGTSSLLAQKLDLLTNYPFSPYDRLHVRMVSHRIVSVRIEGDGGEEGAQHVVLHLDWQLQK